MVEPEQAGKVDEAGEPTDTAEESNLGKLKLNLLFATYEVELNPDFYPARLWLNSSPGQRAGALVGFLLLIGLGLGAWWLWPEPEPVPTLPEIYAVRVVVLDPDGQPTSESEIHSSVGNEPQKVPGGWEVEIPRSKVPENGEVRFWAEDPASGGQGTEPLTLGEDPSPSVQIQLVVPEAMVRGTVFDPQNRALEEAKVSVAGFGDEAVTTDDSGTFELPAHQPRGQRVRIHVEHPDFSAKDQYCSAGSTDCSIYLSTSAWAVPPELIEPPDGAVFTHFPRTLSLNWSEVENARSYRVQLEIQDPVDSSWHSHPGLAERVVEKPPFDLEFVGGQPGRWRVAAISLDGRETTYSAWSHFTFER